MATIIVEDGTGTNPAANSYVSVAELEAYAADRGITIAGDGSELLIKAMDWLLIKAFSGTMLLATQPLHFPTKQSGVPNNIKIAEMVAALETDAGSDLLAPLQPRVIQQTVFGAVSRTFSDKGNQATVFTQLNALIAPFLSSGGGFGFVVSRG